MAENEIKKEDISEMSLNQKLSGAWFTEQELVKMSDDSQSLKTEAVKLLSEGFTKEEIIDLLDLYSILSDEPRKTKFQETIEFFRDLIIIFVVVIFVRTFLAAPFQISGSSMEESYHDGEFILVNKFSYADFGLAKVGDPVRGDVVILRPHASNGKEYYIKRVVGLPGDTVKFEGGTVFLKISGKTDFVKLDEAYLSLANKGKTFLPMDVKETEFTVPTGEYFVMGDNRNNSSDSRSCFMSCSIQGSKHFVSRDNIVGKLFIDFGYINIFREGGVRATGEWKWTHAPRFLSTPKDWVYKELQ